MPFIGKQPEVGAYQLIDAITTSATATYALAVGGTAYFPASARNLIVSLNGITQAPESAYTVSGSNIVFDSALTSSDVIDYILVIGDAVDIGTPSDGTVGTSQMSYPLDNFSSTGIDDNADATAITIDSSENVGIGTTSPDSALVVHGVAGSDSRIHISSGSAGQTSFDGSGSGLLLTAKNMNTTSKFTPAIQFGSKDVDFTTTNPKVGAAINGIAAQTYSTDSRGGMDLAFYTTPNDPGTGQTTTERMRILAEGGLTFNGDTATANALDDYEEGTWTPVVVGSGGTPGTTQTYSNQSGIYRKIGNLVYVGFRVTMTSKGDMGGNYVKLQGLPFAIGGTTVTAGYGGINYWSGLSTSASSLWWELGGGTTDSFYLGYTSSASTASSYMGTSGISNSFYFNASAVYYTS